MKYIWGTSFHDEDVKELLKIKTPQWRYGGVLEERASLIEDMVSYFRKWREWKNGEMESWVASLLRL